MHSRTLRLFAFLACAVLVASCGADRQAAADAVSGVVAAQQVVDTQGQDDRIDTSVAAQLSTILRGVEDYARATAGDRELPSPTRTPERIVAETATGDVSYRQDAAQARDDAGGGLWAWIAGGALALIVAATKAAKRRPGVVGGLATAVDTLLPSLDGLRRRKEQEGRQAVDALIARVLDMTDADWTRLSRLAPGPIADLRDRVLELAEDTRLDPGQRAHITQRLRDTAAAVAQDVLRRRPARPPHTGDEHA